MKVLRRIGKHAVRVDCNSAYGLELDKTLVQSANQSNRSINFTRKQLLQSLASEDEYYPISIHWELLDKCNLACPFCYIVGHSNSRVVRFRDIEQQLSEIVDAGLLFCTLTGGEATIHPDFVEIYGYLRSRGVLVDLFTNGLMLSREIIDALESQKPMTVEVSIYSLDDNVLAEKYGAKAKHPAKAVLNNVLQLKRAGINVSCKTISTTLTEPEIQEISEWCTRHEVHHESSGKIIGAYDGQSLSQFAITTEQPRDSDHVKKIPVEYSALACGTRNYGAAINSAFALYPCPSIRHPEAYFDLRTLGVSEALRKMKAYIRGHQDLKIVASDSTQVLGRPCLANAKPIRNNNGRIIYLMAV